MDKEKLIWIKNNSTQTISITAAYILPDTMLPVKPRKLITINIDHKSCLYSSYIEGDDGYLRRMENGEKLTLFVLNKDSVDNLEWRYIRNNNVILKRYEFNAQELQMMSNVVTYTE
jgi:hypothetical protein